MHNGSSTSLKECNTGTKLQELKKGQDSTPEWINTVTSEGFRRKFIGRQKTVNIYMNIFRF